MAASASLAPALMRPARRYAEAVYAVARDKGQIAPVGADLAAVRGALDADAALLRGLRDPRVNRAERRAMVEKKLLPGRHPVVLGLLKVLVARRREELLPAVLVAYAEVVEREEGLLRVEVQTATELAPAVRAEIEQKLGKATGRPLKLSAETRPEILGGMRFLIDSTLIDASVRSRLERLEKKMLAADV
jgi:F-type H+-transporting ATPase subunit delta